MSQDKNHFAIILCGGSGTRLWPYSRASKPKQFLTFDGDKTLFQKTVLRVSKFFKNENIFIVTNEKFYFETKGQLSDLDINDINIIREPESKNTLPAISYGVREINKVSDNAIIGVFSSDHEIDDDQCFVESCQNALPPVENDKFVVFGIQPTEPNIGYGYINPGEAYLANSDNIFIVSNFVEKPDESTAKKYLDQGYLWNSGMFMFNATMFINALKTYQKDIYENIVESDEELIKPNFSKVPNLSIDYGLLEFMNNVVVVKVKYNWTDLGSWNSIHNSLNVKDNNLPVTKGNVLANDVTNSLILTDEHFIAAYGLTDLVIVHDLDATLICHKSKADDLKPFIESIRKRNSDYLTDHPIVNRPWGHYKVLYEGQTFKIKSILVKPEQKLSLQLHEYRNEHWVVIKGKATVTIDDREFELAENESTYVQKNKKHRLANNTNENLEIIEVSIGSKVIEEDIKRFDDVYDRG
ncbi:mannose-1-phosphate guanylyltransferase/mannose-6-phosphate isomerase [Methylophilaceae bacterium]|nr:mannose-1-phosphate guanylyltransferase/mannose-6-phosphate isomerase [Methylophilaceae bacterium]